MKACLNGELEEKTYTPFGNHLIATGDKKGKRIQVNVYTEEEKELIKKILLKIQKETNKMEIKKLTKTLLSMENRWDTFSIYKKGFTLYLTGERETEKAVQFSARP